MTRALAHRGGVVLRGTRDTLWRKCKKDHSPGNAVRHLGVDLFEMSQVRATVAGVLKPRLGNRLERADFGPRCPSCDVRGRRHGVADNWARCPPRVPVSWVREVGSRSQLLAGRR